MDPEIGSALPDLFARAIELEPEDRYLFVREVAARDAALANELESLLAGAERTVSPIDRSPWRDLESHPDAAARLPERIGRYRVLSELGRGGMGRVFLAEEVEEDFRRMVAVKVIDRPAIDADAVRRFRAEIRILSSLEHPGIARFLDGGRAEDGTLFLALEYVEGEDLLAFAARRALPSRDRIELFLAVLDAVGHAHRQGIVHRDLKPRHLLVGEDGRPRLLDFGISKLVDPETHESVAVTRTESRALTPAYASPEQFRGEPVTPASDVYSLGVVLYELLAGARPFAGITGTALERAVLESDPEPPSTAARELARRGTEAVASDARPSRRVGLSRDLDAICLKALRKRPEERYANAGELASDLRCYLDGRPVTARRGGTRYRFGRLVQRHRGRIASGAAIALAVVALLLAVRAQREADRLRPPPPPIPKPFPFHTSETAPIATLERDFARSPSSIEAGAALALALGSNSRVPEAHIVLARLRQIPGREQDPLIDYVDATLSMSAGEPQRALVLFTRARDAALLGGRGELVGQIRASRGRLLSTMGDRDEARTEMELAREEIARAGDDASLWRVLNDLAIEHLQAGDLDRGSELLESAIDASRRAGEFAHISLVNLGMVSMQRGRPDLGEPLIREVTAHWRTRSDKRRLGEALGFLGDVVRDLGREEAIANLQEPGGEANLLGALVTRAAIALDAAQLQEAESVVLELETVSNRIGDRRGIAYAHHFRGRIAAEWGELARAREQLAVARRLLVENGDLDQVAETDVACAAIERRSGAAAEAERLLDEAFARLPGGASQIAAAFLAETLRARIDVDLARAGDAAARLARLDASRASSPSVSFRLAYLAARAAVADAEGRRDAARSDLGTAVAAATAAGRTLEALDLRIDLASLQPRDGGALEAIEREASERGLVALAHRARSAAGRALPAQGEVADQKRVVPHSNPSANRAPSRTIAAPTSATPPTSR